MAGSDLQHVGPIPGHDASCCDCGEGAPEQAPAGGGNVWSALLAVLACALCPACLASYTQLLSLLGVSLALDETLHHVFLVGALGVSVGVSGWRSWRTARVWPVLIAVGGSALVAGGHLLGELAVLEWAGVLVLLSGGLTEHMRFRRRAPARLAPGRSRSTPGVSLG